MIIQVYAPTGDCTEADSHNFYQKIDNQIRELGGVKDKCLIVMGDLNATVGNEEEPGIVGRFGLGERNDKGQLLVDFCKEKKLIIKSTFGTQAEKDDILGQDPMAIFENN